MMCEFDRIDKAGPNTAQNKMDFYHCKDSFKGIVWSFMKFCAVVIDSLSLISREISHKTDRKEQALKTNFSQK